MFRVSGGLRRTGVGVRRIPAGERNISSLRRPLLNPSRVLPSFKKGDRPLQALKLVRRLA